MVPKGGRSRPSLTFATPVHGPGQLLDRFPVSPAPCTMESNHRHADFQSEGVVVNLLKYIHIKNGNIH
jgi:hypothetical protein